MTIKNQFTFHYASTLSLPADPSLVQVLHLHSTMLLLYLIFNDATEITVQHLHSTMLLLYLKGLQFCLGQAYIYIPLCFYFIEGNAVLPVIRARIYIPLCFYFITETTTDSIFITTFTFHYASTLSLHRVVRPYVDLHLHSTMLLLYPSSVKL